MGTVGASQAGKNISCAVDASERVGKSAFCFFDGRGDNTAPFIAATDGWHNIALDQLGGDPVLPLEVIGVGSTIEENALYEDEIIELFESFIPDLDSAPIKLDILRHLVKAFQQSPAEIRAKYGASQFHYLCKPKLPQYAEILEGLPAELWHYFKEQKSLHASTHMSTFGAARRPWEMSLGSPEVRKRDVGHGINWRQVETEKWLVIQQGTSAVSDTTITTITKLRLAEIIRYKQRQHG